MTLSSLEKLFYPNSIAVVGASSSPGKAGYEMLAAISNFHGDLYPINPNAHEILGMKAFPTIAAVGKPVDLAILTLPAQRCLSAVQDAADAGVGAIMIISGGFAETGEAGKQRQNEILRICQHNGIRLLGPNTSGFAIPSERLAVSFAPGMDALQPGSVAIISQSGAINLALAALAAELNLGIGLAVGIGNGQDVSAASVVDYLADDPKITVITCYLEGVSNGRQLFGAIAKATLKKPVVIFTVGKADVGEFAASHTGNLIGSFQLKVSALKQAGAVVVNSTNEMMDAAKLLAAVRLKPKRNPGVALLTGQAGPGMIISDYLRANQVDMPRLGADTVEHIGRLLPPMTFIKNPIDTGRPGKNFAEILDTVSSDASIDAILTFALHEPAAIKPEDIFSNRHQRAEQALIFGTAGIPDDVTPTIRNLDELNIPAFPSPDRVARATAALIADCKAAYRRNQEPVLVPIYASTPLTNVLNEAQAKDLMATIGVAVPQHSVCSTRQQVAAAFTELPKPVVVKVLSTEILHKTEVGGVHLNVDSEAKLELALTQIDSITVSEKVQYLIESMAPPGLEIILGGTNDQSFGSTVLLGLGGTAAEAMEDVSIRVAPLFESDALEMIEELRSAALFNGWRGAPKLDKQAVARALVSLGRFLAEHPEIKEIDLNPVRVYPKGLLALDALIVLNRM